ncbi:unnamed protein product [Prorocentrum cordatum]|uniref:Uncharacterized protein n=1 Tax=Prorocentrum cordatum TaxID=2364126 RepID=A0ABN9XE20_9DINO|nr:unnamed protein product [Polarella glacialis]
MAWPRQLRCTVMNAAGPDAGLGPSAPYSSRSLSSRRTAQNSARAQSSARGGAGQEPSLDAEAHWSARVPPVAQCGADCTPESEVMPPLSARAPSLSTARSGGSRGNVPAGRPFNRRLSQSGFGLYVDVTMPTSEEGPTPSKLVL